MGHPSHKHRKDETENQGIDIHQNQVHIAMDM